jgi:hypothetical protein
MHKKLSAIRAACAAATVVALGVLVVVPSASAHTGEYAKFNYCPSTNSEVVKCLYASTEGGEFVLGTKRVPVVNPVVLQGGTGAADPATHYSKFYAATNGETLTKASQPVPGGLSGLVNCKEISNWFLRGSCEVVFENGLTGVKSTLELAKPASEIQISERYQFFGEQPALKLPVKVHLENPLLGSECYIGSEGSPIWLNLTTGATKPPPPASPISGSPGTGSLVEGSIVKFTGVKLVDNTWAAPGANGCGGPVFEYILDPILNLSVGVPSSPGSNVAVQEVTLYNATTANVNKH